MLDGAWDIVVYLRNYLLHLLFCPAAVTSACSHAGLQEMLLWPITVSQHRAACDYSVMTLLPSFFFCTRVMSSTWAVWISCHSVLSAAGGPKAILNHR